MTTAQTGGRSEAAAGQGFCTSCGAAFTGGAFCGRCGGRMARADASEALPVSRANGVPASLPRQTRRQGPLDDAPTVVLPAGPSSSENAAQSPGAFGLPWQDDELEGQPDAEGRDETDVRGEVVRSRRRGLLPAVALAVVAVLVLAAVGISRYVGDGDLRAAFRSSTPSFNAALSSFSAATTAEQVAGAAGKASESATAVDGALRRLGSVRGTEAAAVRSQLEAEKALLGSLGLLAGVGTDPLGSWAGAHIGVTAAMQVESASRAALRKYRNDDAGRLADTGVMMAKVISAVGPALAQDATDESARFLQSLKSAATVADLRKVGSDAAPAKSALDKAAQALPEGAGKQTLTASGTALSALAQLASIDADNTGSWPATRAGLAQTFGQLAAASASGSATGQTALTDALASADAVVSAAAAAIADWKAKTDAAIKARGADIESVDAYATSFRSQAKGYGQLRQDLSAFTDRVEAPGVNVSYFEGYQFLSQAAQDRRRVRDSMISSKVPKNLQQPHDAVVAALSRGIVAVQSAYDGLEQSQDCYQSCYYRDTPGWQAFQSESDAISKSYSAAVTQWDAAVVAEKTAVENRALPAKPTV